MTGASDLSHILSELADLAEIRGAAATAADLRRARTAITALPSADTRALLQRARRNRLRSEPGISPTLHWRLHEIALGGGAPSLAAARAGTPALFRDLFRLELIAPAEAVALVRQFGILTLPDLAVTLDDERLTALVGQEVTSRLRSAAGVLISGARPVTLGRAFDLLDRFATAFAASCSGIEEIAIAGDVRRYEPLPQSLALVARAADPPSAVESLCALPGIEDVLHRGSRRAVLLVQQSEIDVRLATRDDFGTVLFRATGPPAHVVAVQRRRSTPRLAGGEADVYAHAGLPYLPPELRRGIGETDAAARPDLPRLVTREDIRGDLHMHTTYSDGRDTLAVMVAECCALGYEYLAITDHSPTAAASRTVSLDQLERQREEIAVLRERFPSIVILHGIEADILPDGRLDFDDRVLASLDIVLASLHERAGQDGPALTRRMLAAIRHPLVAVITHPANQLVGQRGGYPLDFPAIYEAAAETGTALEIDGAPGHLDLDGDRAREAVAAGVTVCIDSDCHRARSLGRQMQLGVGTARRGWVEPHHVLNTRPIGDVRAFIAAKRRARG